MSRLLKNPVLNASTINAKVISSGSSAPVKITGSLQLDSIGSLTFSNSTPNALVVTDANGNLKFGDFSTVKSLPGFAASNLQLGSTASNTAGAVALSSTTSVTDAIVQLNEQIVNYAPHYRRYEFNTSTVWLVQHNMNTTRFFESLTDVDGNRFSARINIIDANSFQVTMTSATAGTVDVNFVVN
jgi:hypothetical protein